MARTSKASASRSLRIEYARAKDARRKAGKAWRARKVPSTLAAYRHAERKWQIIGEELGKRSRTHKPRHAQTRIFGKGKRRKSTRARRSR